MNRTVFPGALRRQIRSFVLIGLPLMVVMGAKTACILAETGEAIAQDRNEALKVQRFELMRERVAALTIQSDEPGFPDRFGTKPIFKYSDPARRYVAASVWKLGDEGRPKALLALELHRLNSGKPSISYEYASLTKTPFAMSEQKLIWSPKGTLYQFSRIPDAAPPEKTAALRLIQLRSLAKRFASNEVVNKEKCELRLLPQPVARYIPSSVERADGAIFFFTFGTNPEVVLLIESDGQAWEYAAGRMTGAEEVILTLDNKTVWEGAPLQPGLHSPFTGDTKAVDIPGIASDGSEIRE